MMQGFRFRWRGLGASKTPVIRQAVFTECGLACLAMIAAYWGWRIDLGSLRTLAPPSLKGASLKSIVKLAQQHGLESRVVKAGQPADLSKVRLPAIVHVDEDHFVVLTQVRRKNVVVHDPAAGRVSMTYRELADRWTGIVAEFVPGGTFEARDERKTLSLTSVWSHLAGVAPTVLQIVILSIFLQFSAVVSPLYIQLTVDEAVTRLDVDLLNVLFAGFAGLAAVNCLAFFLRRIVTLRVGQALSFGLMSNLFRHMTRLPATFYEQRHLGDVTSRFHSTTAVQSFLTGPALDALVDTVAALISLAVLFLYGAKFALVVLAIVVFGGILHFSTIELRRLLAEDKLATEARESTLFLETIRAVRSIKLFGRETERFDHWQGRLADMTGANYRHGAADAAIRSGSDLIETVGAALVVFLTARAAMGGNFTIGMMMSFIAYQAYFGRTAKNAVDALVSWKTLSVHLDRLADLALAEPENNERGMRPDISGLIEVRKASFRYHPDEPMVLSDISLTITPGEMVAITGPSGEGKTTLLKVLLGTEPLTSGEVLYDGINLNRIARSHFVANIATVMQDDTLLSGSIAENIAFFDAELDHDRIKECAQVACIHRDITAMPMGYASLIGDMGSALSGGQKQRIMIARALYRRPRILFMDEGTSHLDIEVEHEINNNIASLDITRVVIAHRPDTLRIANRIHRLEGKLLVSMRN